MTVRAEGKRDFATRLSPETLAQLDELVRRGGYKTRTAGIETAVARLHAAERETAQQEYERKKKILDRICGVVSLGLTSEEWRELEDDRLEYEIWKQSGRK